MKGQLTFLIITILFLSNMWAAPGDVRYLSFETEENFSSGDFIDRQKESGYFTIKHIKVTELEVSEEDRADGLVEKELGSFIMTAQNLIALGTKIWEIIKEGRPVSNVQMATPISVLPKTGDEGQVFSEMENWSAPQVRKYHVEYTNLWGMNVVSFTYMIHFQPNGEYRGKGQYLTGLKFTASQVSVAWGFQFDASSELVTISNRGRAADPVAGATIEIQYKISSMIQNITAGQTFHVTGEGEVSQY